MILIGIRHSPMPRISKAALGLATIFCLILLPVFAQSSHAILPPVSCTSVADFAISPDKPFLEVLVDGTNSSGLELTSINGFSGTILLSVAAASPGITATLSSTSVPLTAGGSASSSLLVSVLGPSPPIFSVVTVNGTSGSLFHTALLYVHVVKPGFSISADPDFLEFPPGGSGTSLINLTSDFGFAGRVALSAMVSGLGSLPAAFLSHASVDLPGAPTVTLTVDATSPLVLPGYYSVLVIGASGPVNDTASVYILVTEPGFALETNPMDLTILAGLSGSSSIKVSSLKGFSGTVDLTADSFDLVASVSPTSVTVGPGTPGTATLDVSVPAGTSPGSYFVGVSGSSGSVFNGTSVLVTVPGPDFNMTANPETLTIAAGSAGSSTISLISVYDFSGDVSLSLLCAPGVSATIAPPTVHLAAGGTGSSKLDVSVSSYTPAGLYYVFVNGTSGSRTHFALVPVSVTSVSTPDFSLVGSVSSLTVVQGSSGTATYTLTSLNGFSGLVTLTANAGSVAGLDASFSRNTVPLSSGGTGTSTLTISTTGATPVGTHHVAVTGNSGSLSHTTFLDISVTPVPTPDFTISASPTIKGPLDPGAHGTGTISISSLNSFIGTIDLTAAPSPGLSAILSPTSVTGGSGTSTLDVTAPIAGTYTVTVTGTSGALAHTTAVITVNVVDFTITASSPNPVATGQPAISTISLTALNSFAGTVDFYNSSPVGLTCDPFVPPSVTGSGTTVLSCSSATAGDYPVTVTGTSGSLTHSATTTFSFTSVPDFSITASSPSLVNIGDPASSTVTLIDLNGFAGDVALSDTPLPTGLTCGLIAPSIVTIPPQATATLSCSATATGSYAVTITGTSGSISHSKTVTFNFGDFTLDASPVSVGPIITGSSGTSTITVTSQNGFMGDVSLTANPSAGLTAALNSPSVIGSGTSTLTLSATAAGTYTVTVTGISGTLSHTTGTITVTVTAAPPPDFSVSASRPSMSIQAGDNAASTITFTSLNGFTGIVSISVVVSPSGPQASLNPTSLTLGVSGTSTLTVAVPVSAGNGPYTVTVTGTNGSTSHTTTIAVTVTSLSTTPPQQAASNILGLDPTLFYILIGVLAVAALSGAATVMVRRKPPSPQARA